MCSLKGVRIKITSPRGNYLYHISIVLVLKMRPSPSVTRNNIRVDCGRKVEESLIVGDGAAEVRGEVWAHDLCRVERRTHLSIQKTFPLPPPLPANFEDNS